MWSASEGADRAHIRHTISPITGHPTGEIQSSANVLDMHFNVCALPSYESHPAGASYSFNLGSKWNDHVLATVAGCTRVTSFSDAGSFASAAVRPAAPDKPDMHANSSIRHPATSHPESWPNVSFVRGRDRTFSLELLRTRDLPRFAPRSISLEAHQVAAGRTFQNKRTADGARCAGDCG